ncbi:MAG: SDR family NAD(P)-dependent oxidoreductase [Actinomycetota bacterium]|nr:SDR family NAD(P)-dependent oxidoreductase [Actinomycetota bacterium]
MTNKPRDKKVSVVAGGGRGIGASVAQFLAKLEHEVIVLDFPKPIDFGIYESGSIEGTNHHALGVDLRDMDATKRCAEEVVNTFGKVDTLTITAGAIDGGGSFLELDDLGIIDAVTKNVISVHNCIKAFVPHLAPTSWTKPHTRSIVALTSVASIKPLRGLASYSAAKGGVRSYLMVAAVELSDMQVRLNIVAPGSTRGAMLDASRDLYHLSSSDEFATHHLSKRIIEADEIAMAIMALHENPAMIAAEVVVDGGMSRA